MVGRSYAGQGRGTAAAKAREAASAEARASYVPPTSTPSPPPKAPPGSYYEVTIGGKTYPTNDPQALIKQLESTGKLPSQVKTTTPTTSSPSVQSSFQPAKTTATTPSFSSAGTAFDSSRAFGSATVPTKSPLQMSIAPPKQSAYGGRYKSEYQLEYERAKLREEAPMLFVEPSKEKSLSQRALEKLKLSPVYTFGNVAGLTAEEGIGYGIIEQKILAEQTQKKAQAELQLKAFGAVTTEKKNLDIFAAQRQSFYQSQYDQQKISYETAVSSLTSEVTSKQNEASKRLSQQFTGKNIQTTPLVFKGETVLGTSFNLEQGTEVKPIIEKYNKQFETAASKRLTDVGLTEQNKLVAPLTMNLWKAEGEKQRLKQEKYLREIGNIEAKTGVSPNLFQETSYVAGLKNKPVMPYTITQGLIQSPLKTAGAAVTTAAFVGVTAISPPAAVPVLNVIGGGLMGASVAYSGYKYVKAPPEETNLIIGEELAILGGATAGGLAAAGVIKAAPLLTTKGRASARGESALKGYLGSEKKIMIEQDFLVKQFKQTLKADVETTIKGNNRIISPSKEAAQLLDYKLPTQPAETALLGITGGGKKIKFSGKGLVTNEGDYTAELFLTKKPSIGKTQQFKIFEDVVGEKSQYSVFQQKKGKYEEVFSAKYKSPRESIFSFGEATEQFARQEDVSITGDFPARSRIEMNVYGAKGIIIADISGAKLVPEARLQTTTKTSIFTETLAPATMKKEQLHTILNEQFDRWDLQRATTKFQPLKSEIVFVESVVKPLSTKIDYFKDTSRLLTKETIRESPLISSKQKTGVKSLVEINIKKNPQEILKRTNLVYDLLHYKLFKMKGLVKKISRLTEEYAMKYAKKKQLEPTKKEKVLVLSSPYPFFRARQLKAERLEATKQALETLDFLDTGVQRRTQTQKKTSIGQELKLESVVGLKQETIQRVEVPIRRTTLKPQETKIKIPEYEKQLRGTTVRPTTISGVYQRAAPSLKTNLAPMNIQANIIKTTGITTNVNIAQKTFQLTDVTPKLTTRQIMPKIPTYPMNVRTNIRITPPTVPIRTPGFFIPGGWGVGFKPYSAKSERYRRFLKYSPSVVAAEFKIKGRAANVLNMKLTGLEVRPIIM